MPHFAPHQHFSGVGWGAVCATPTPLTPGPTAHARRLDRLGGAVSEYAATCERDAERRAVKSGEEIA